MTQKNRQDQLFTGAVTFDGPVKFNGAVTVKAVYGSGPSSLLVGRAVVAADGDLGHADSSEPSHADRLIGIYAGQGLVAMAGQVTGPWSFTVGDVLYVGFNGLLTPTVPNSGFQQQVGVAVGSSSLVISIGPAIMLAG